MVPVSSAGLDRTEGDHCTHARATLPRGLCVKYKRIWWPSRGTVERLRSHRDQYVGRSRCLEDFLLCNFNPLHSELNAYNNFHGNLPITLSLGQYYESTGYRGI